MGTEIKTLACCTSRPRAQTSVVIRTRVVPERNSPMIASLSFCGISPCIAETVKLLLRIFSVNQSTYSKCRKTEMKDQKIIEQYTTDSIKNQQCPTIKGESEQKDKGISYEAWRASVYLSLGVTKNNSLCYGEGIIKITQGIKLPIFPFNSHKKLLDALS